MHTEKCAFAIRFDQAITTAVFFIAVKQDHVRVMADLLAHSVCECPFADHAGKMRLSAAALHGFIDIIGTAAALHLLRSDVDVLLAGREMRHLKQHIHRQ